MTLDRVPPQSRDAERAAIGSMLRDNGIIDDVSRLIDAEAFYFDAHQKIARAIFDLRNQAYPVDLVTLHSELHRRKHSEDIGGAAYLAELWDATTSGANAVYYAGIVRDKWLSRELIHLTTELGRDAFDQSMPADQLMESAERQILQLTTDRTAGDPVTLQQSLAEAFAEIDRRSSSPGELFGLTTGYLDLDSKTGGLHRGELTIIAGRPGDGKTTLAANMMVRSCQSKAKILFFSMEMSRIEIAERICCSLGKVDHFNVRRNCLSAADKSALLDANDKLNGYDLWIEDSSAVTMGRIAATCRRHRRRNGLDAVFIDYLQLISPDDRRVSRVEQIDDISRRLKQLAREIRVPVVALCQLNRESEATDGPPKLRHLRESGGIEQNADNVFALHRPGKADGEDNTMEVHVLKQRNGPTGYITLAWLKKFLTFEDYAIGEADEPTPQPPPKSKPQREHYSDRV